MSRELTAWIARLFEDPAMTGMGQAQRLDDLNLGLGWIYYGMARLVRPQRVVVIGSFRGFAPMVLAKALVDNGEGGRVTFLDPSFVDDFWRDASRVTRHFAAHGLHNIDHHCVTTAEFAGSEAWYALGKIGLLLVDGYHTEQQARFDHETFKPLLHSDGYALFHDSVRERTSRIYGEDRAYQHTVKRYMDSLRADPAWEVITLPHGDGLSLVRFAGVVP